METVAVALERPSSASTLNQSGSPQEVPVAAPTSRSRITRRTKATFLCFNMCIALGLLELVARALVPAPLDWREHPAQILRFDPCRGWALRPDAEDFTVDKPVHVNHDGFRDREFPLERTLGVQRVVCLGDSYTYGWGVELEDSLPKQLERAVSLEAPTECLNMGVFGYNAAQ